MKKIENTSTNHEVKDIKFNPMKLEEFTIEIASILTEMKFKDQAYIHPILSEAQFFNQTYTPQAQDYFSSAKEFVENKLNKTLEL